MSNELAVKPRDLVTTEIAFQANLYADPNPSRRWLHATRRAWVTTALEGEMAKGAKLVLEVGVGAGLYTRFLSDRECSVLALDINQGFIEAVAALPGVTARCQDVCDLRDTGFDLALCSEVLEHLPPDRSELALQRMHDALRPGGALVLTTPQSYSTAELFARLLDLPLVLAFAKRLYGAADALGHTNRLTHGQLSRQLTRVGFIVEVKALRALYVPVLAEFFGASGQRIASWLERRIRNVPVLSGLIWTQCYVLRRADQPVEGTSP